MITVITVSDDRIFLPLLLLRRLVAACYIYDEQYYSYGFLTMARVDAKNPA